MDYIYSSEALLKSIRLTMDISIRLSELANHQGRFQKAIYLADFAHDLGTKWFLLKSGLSD